MRKETIEDIYALVLQLFPENKIERENFHNPEAVELRIETSNEEIKNISLSFYDNIVMHMGNFDLKDFEVEYDKYSEAAANDIKQHLLAIVDGKIQIKTKKIFGITVDKKLIIVG